MKPIIFSTGEDAGAAVAVVVLGFDIAFSFNLKSEISDLESHSGRTIP
jgi:hypothetical protein